MYSNLAIIYDYLVAGVDYKAWVDYLKEILKRFNYVPQTLVDLACGTGNIILPLAESKLFLSLTGVDISPEMVDVARKKAKEKGLNVKFLVQDMRCFQLNELVQLITCFHDGLNYILSYRDLVRVFSCVYKNLIQKGMFIFDLNAIFWLAALPVEPGRLDDENISLSWESKYEEPFWEVRLNILIKKSQEVFTEIHRERGYSPEEVEQALKEANLKLMAAYDAFTFSPVKKDSRRHFYVVKKID